MWMKETWRFQTKWSSICDFYKRNWFWILQKGLKQVSWCVSTIPRQGGKLKGCIQFYMYCSLTVWQSRMSMIARNEKGAASMARWSILEHIPNFKSFETFKIQGECGINFEVKVFFNSPRCIIIIKDMFILLSLSNYPRLV
jgi:hypothetical protein